MAIVVNLDVEMAKRKIRSNELARLVGITEQNLSILKTGKARAVRFSTLNLLCRTLDCSPGELLAYAPDDQDEGSESHDDTVTSSEGTPP
jgi:putative transcriptional regulator